jgi:hypothetical protein
MLRLPGNGGQAAGVVALQWAWRGKSLQLMILFNFLI